MLDIQYLHELCLKKEDPKFKFPRQSGKTTLDIVNMLGNIDLLISGTELLVVIDVPNRFLDKSIQDVIIIAKDMSFIVTRFRNDRIYIDDIGITFISGRDDSLKSNIKAGYNLKNTFYIS